MIYPTADLKRIMSELKVALTDSSSYPTGNRVVISEGWFSAFNGQIGVHSPYENDFSVVVEAPPLIELINNNPLQDMVLELRERGLYAKFGRTQAYLPTFEDNGLSDQIAKGFESVKWQPLTKELVDAITFCSFSAAPKDVILSKGVMSAVKVKGGDVVATDGWRLAWQQLHTPIPKGVELFVPAHLVSHIFKYNLGEYALGGGTNLYLSGGDDDPILTIPVMAGEYPKWQPILDIEGDRVDLPSEELINSITKVASFGIEHSAGRIVKVQFEGGKVTVLARSNKGWAKDSFKASYKGQEFYFYMSSTFLKDAAAISKTMVNGQNMVLFEGEGFKHVVCKYAVPEGEKEGE